MDSNSPKAGSSWVAKLELNFSKSTSKTFLSKRKHVGPLTLQRPFYPEDGVCHLYLLHPPGGVVGGDALRLEVKMDHHSNALITTPGATKIYKSANNRRSIVNQIFTLEAHSALEWLPMETIVFPGAQSHFLTKFYLTGNAQIAAWEVQCLGRPAINETFDAGHLKFNFEVWRDGFPLMIDKMQIHPFELNNAAGLRGYPIFATFIISPVSDNDLALIRAECVPNESYIVGVTKIENMAIIRCLGHKTHLIQALFRRIWQKIRPVVFNKEAVIPRIWAT